MAQSLANLRDELENFCRYQKLMKTRGGGEKEVLQQQELEK